MNELKEWIKQYLNHRDMMFGRIKGFKDTADNVFEVEYIDETKVFYIEPELDKIDPEGNIAIVLLSSKHNLDGVIKEWSNLKKNPKLSVYFVNLRTNQKCIINPYTHSKIADSATLKRGIESMLESIDNVG